MAKITQKQIIINILKETGFISRNHALSMFISRLSAIIQDLEEEGFEFTTQQIDGNYIYTVKNPAKKEVRKQIVTPLEDGSVRITYQTEYINKY